MPLDEAGRSMLADFGLARMLEASAYFTQAGEVLGTALKRVSKGRSDDARGLYEGDKIVSKVRV